jgi:hypothetical protein
MFVGFKVCFTKTKYSWSFETYLLQNIPSKGHVIEKKPLETFENDILNKGNW